MAKVLDERVLRHEGNDALIEDTHVLLEVDNTTIVLHRHQVFSAWGEPVDEWTVEPPENAETMFPTEP
jgi:hypothetical protein